MFKTTKSRPFKVVCLCLIMSFLLLEVSVAAPANLGVLTEADIKAAKEMLDSSGAQTQTDAGFNLQPAITSPQAPSETERAMSDGLPEGQILSQFGYDAFNRIVSTFSPVTDVPVGPD